MRRLCRYAVTFAFSQRVANSFLNDRVILRSHNADVNWPEPQTKTQRIARAADFWWRISPMVAGYAALMIESEISIRLPGFSAGESEVEAKWLEQHEKGSRSALMILFIISE